MVAMAYFQVSEDSISGAKQKGHMFKSSIESVLSQCWGSEKRSRLMKPQSFLPM